jgi:trimeric autotransporter adhesin
MNPLIQLQKAASVFLVALVCFGLLPITQAVSPPPDGGYAGGNTAEGQKALFSLATGGFNTAVGWRSLETNTTGQFNTGVGAGTLALNTADENTAIGTGALLLNITGTANTADGAFALFHNTTGIQNTATGATALFSNTTGGNNTAVGISALFTNSTGSANTAGGYKALVSNTTGNENTASGASALFSNITGNFNTANGAGALELNIAGGENTATGYHALMNNTGDNNTAAGFESLLANTTGTSNTAIGIAALTSNTDGNNNTAIGNSSLLDNTHGSNNIALGFFAGQNHMSGDNNIYIDSGGFDGEVGTIRIGNANHTRTVIAGIRGAGLSDGIPVYIDSGGELGTSPSSRRFKEQIKRMDKASEAILSLNPVTFHYKSDRTNRPEFGLIAEEVAAVNPDLVVRDKDGDIYTVRYDAVNAMLLNEFLKEHRKVQEQEATIALLKQDFQSKLAEQQKQIEALTEGLQKVNAQLATASPSGGGLQARNPRQQVVSNP